MDAVPAAIEGLRPGQTGVVVLGRVIMGDIAVTLVDLIQRGFLTVEETTDHGDWRLTLVTGTGTKKQKLGGVLLDYEKRLLDGLSEDGGESRLSSLAARFGKALDETPIRGRRWSGSPTPRWGLSSTCRAGRRRNRSVRSTSAISRFSGKSRPGRG